MTDSVRDPLLLTKLNRPGLPHNLVVRTRLLEVLNHAIDHPLTLVCAPAGFGKTTLVCTWLERYGCRSVCIGSILTCRVAFAG